MGNTIELGSKAAEFSLQGTGGQEVSLAEYQGKQNVLLVFYPKADTPG